MCVWYHGGKSPRILNTETRLEYILYIKIINIDEIQPEKSGIQNVSQFNRLAFKGKKF